MKKKVLVWETLATVSGGQKITLTVMDSLREEYDFHCLIPAEGRLSEELSRRNIPYTVIGDQSLPAGVKGRSVIFRYGLMSLRCIMRSLSVIRKMKPDILYAPGPAALPWSAVCGTLSRKPVIWHLHHIFMDRMTGKLLNVCSKWKCIRRIISVSECVGKQIIDQKARKKLSILYNPIDVDFYRSGDKSKVIYELEHKLGRQFTAKTAVIGHIALIQRPKKQDLVLRVIGELKKRGVDAVGLFCGECREPEYFEEINTLALELGIAEDVLFLGWRDDVPDLLKCMDALLVPSNEGFSLVGQEAAAVGVPSVVCDVSGVGEFMRLSGSGMMFREDDAEDATEKTLAVIENKEDLARHGIAYSEFCRVEIYKNGIREVFDRAVMSENTVK